MLISISINLFDYMLSFSIKLFALRVTPPAHSGTAFAPMWPKMAPSWHQNGTKNQPKSRLGVGTPWARGRPRAGYPMRPWAKNSEKNKDPTKKRADSHRAPPVEPKKRPTWLQVGLQNRSKIDKKSMQKSIVFLMPLGVDLWTNFVDCCFQNEAKLGPKWDQKSM